MGTGTTNLSSAPSFRASARAKSARDTIEAPAQCQIPRWPLRHRPMTISAALSASVGETTWSWKARTCLPSRNWSAAAVAKVRFAPGRPLYTTATRATAQSGASSNAASSPARLVRAYTPRGFGGSSSEYGPRSPSKT